MWAYSQPGFTDEEIAFTLDAQATYKSLRHDLPPAVPCSPLGLPGWADDWLGLGLRAGGTTYVSVWRRGGDPQQRLPVPHLRARTYAPRLRTFRHRRAR
ncbi:hypothetical protein [Streptomyces flavidovirens]|uniref:hypothetical protein n=1 Tax=Streptomyces flavidovirens TaxID=67298 RepID=UPI0004903F52